MRELLFEYIPGRPALSEIDLDIQQGEFIGIVGTSGAGKTTFVDLILAFLEPTSGRVEVNGFPLHEYAPLQWRGKLGYVPQETILFNETVHNNIALYREGITEDDVRWAATVAHADEFIDMLPEGFHTTVGDRGAKLSGGQKQRLALARAIVHRPQILILDEATSALDSIAEKKIQESVESLRGQVTIVAIAHRLSTVMNADRVIVLEEGRIAEQGRPSELVRSDGRFHEMYVLQSARG